MSDFYGISMTDEINEMLNEFNPYRQSTLLDFIPDLFLDE